MSPKSPLTALLALTIAFTCTLPSSRAIDCYVCHATNQRDDAAPCTGPMHKTTCGSVDAADAGDQHVVHSGMETVLTGARAEYCLTVRYRNNSVGRHCGHLFARARGLSVFPPGCTQFAMKVGGIVPGQYCRCGGRYCNKPMRGDSDWISDLNTVEIVQHPPHYPNATSDGAKVNKTVHDPALTRGRLPALNITSDLAKVNKMVNDSDSISGKKNVTKTTPSTVTPGKVDDPDAIVLEEGEEIVDEEIDAKPNAGRPYAVGKHGFAAFEFTAAATTEDAHSADWGDDDAADDDADGKNDAGNESYETADAPEKYRAAVVRSSASGVLVCSSAIVAVASGMCACCKCTLPAGLMFL